jgi:hypothetical protein
MKMGKTFQSAYGGTIPGRREDDCPRRRPVYKKGYSLMTGWCPCGQCKVALHGRRKGAVQNVVITRLCLSKGEETWLHDIVVGLFDKTWFCKNGSQTTGWYQIGEDGRLKKMGCLPPLASTPNVNCPGAIDDMERQASSIKEVVFASVHVGRSTSSYKVCYRRTMEEICQAIYDEAVNRVSTMHLMCFSSRRTAVSLKTRVGSTICV